MAKMTTEEYLQTLTPEQRAKRAASLKRAEEIEAEVAKLNLPEQERFAEVNRRLRKELPEEYRKAMEQQNKVFAELFEADKEKFKTKLAELKAQEEKLLEWEKSGEAPKVYGLPTGATHDSAYLYQAFLALTGIKATSENRKLVSRLSQTGYFAFVYTSLATLKKLSFLSAVAKKYAAGDISEQLADILSITPEFPTSERMTETQLPTADPREYIAVFLGKHPEHAATYKGVKDVESSWYMFHRFVVAPFQRFDYFGSIDDLYPYTETQRNILTAQVKAVFNTAFDSKLNKLQPEQLAELIDLLNHPTLWTGDEEHTVSVSIVPEAYFNIGRDTVYDLRPYKEELEGLLAISPVGYLQDFAGLLQQIIKEYKTGKAVKTTAKKAEKVEYPLDKINSGMWKLLEKDSKKQLSFAVEKIGSNKEVSITYYIDFDKLEGIKITKKLTQFDKRVYIAASALWNAGNKVISLTQIHYAMGNTLRPSGKQLEKINESITKMTNAAIYVNNIEEIKNKYNYPKVHYDGALLPIERMTATVNGKLSDAAIHLFREPPMMTFAKARGQVTTLEIKLLQSPINKTDSNLAIDDYLLERISHAKNAAGKEAHKPPNKRKTVIKTILLETLYQETGLNTRLQKSRAIPTIRKYLDHYMECGLIKTYEILNNKITFDF